MTTARRDEFGYLFVVTYGRSGSTLLMGLLNSVPGYLVRGENWDALHHLFRFHRTLAEGSQRWDPARLRQRTHPFFGAGDFPVQRSIEGTRRLVLDTVLRPEGRHPRHRVQGDPLVRRRRRGVRRVAARGVPGRPLRREHPRPRGGPAQRLVGQAARERRAAPCDRGADPGPGRGARRRGVPRPLQRLCRRPVRAARAVRLAGRAVRRGRGAVGAGDAATRSAATRTG